MLDKDNTSISSWIRFDEQNQQMSMGYTHKNEIRRKIGLKSDETWNMVKQDRNFEERKVDFVPPLNGIKRMYIFVQRWWYHNPGHSKTINDLKRKIHNRPPFNLFKSQNSYIMQSKYPDNETNQLPLHECNCMLNGTPQCAELPKK